MGPWFDFLLSWSAWHSPQVKTEPQISPTVNQSEPVNGLILTHSYTLSLSFYCHYHFKALKRPYVVTTVSVCVRLCLDCLSV